MSDLTTGAVVDKPVKVKEKPMRKTEEYKGEPPLSGDQKSLQSFPIQEKCGITDEKGKCALKLNVVRQKNTKFVRDDVGFGGQLEYDEKDIHQYKQCVVHGPFPAGPEKW